MAIETWKIMITLPKSYILKEETKGLYALLFQIKSRLAMTIVVGSNKKPPMERLFTSPIT